MLAQHYVTVGLGRLWLDCRVIGWAAGQLDCWLNFAIRYRNKKQRECGQLTSDEPLANTYVVCNQ